MKGVHCITFFKIEYKGAWALLNIFQERVQRCALINIFRKRENRRVCTVQSHTRTYFNGTCPQDFTLDFLMNQLPQVAYSV